MEDYPGPFAEEIGLQITNLAKSEIQALDTNISLKNGLVLELSQFVSKNKLPNFKVSNWIQLLDPSCCQTYSLKTLQSKISRTVEIGKKLKKKKKCAMFKTVDEFEGACFFNKQNKKLDSDSQPNLISTDQLESPTIASSNVSHSEQQLFPANKTTQSITVQTEKDQNVLADLNDSFRKRCTTNDNIKKEKNLLSYELIKEQKKLLSLQNLIQVEQEKLEHLQAVNGHYSVRNVNKRDENARNTRKALRMIRSVQLRQEKELSRLKDECTMLQTRLHTYENEIMVQNDLADKVMELENKKIKAQKLSSHYRSVIQKLKSNKYADEKNVSLRQKQNEIEYLKAENDVLREKLTEKRVSTKSKDGSFSNDVRLCVVELFALEVGMEKIPSAMQTVSKHLFNCNLEKTDLPTAQTVRNIIDEGHFLAKSYIAEKVKNADNIGISRDGTTRKKEKIVDTSITLDSGQVLSLGFSKVSRETAENINNVTKKRLTELAETSCYQTEDAYKKNQVDDFISKSLEKLSFTMSDRASNEKLADKLLNEWRDNILKQCSNDNERQSVFRFHCMAHVLLGFHRYVTEDLKKFEKSFTEENGPIGRDLLPNFKYWSKKQTVAERIVYTASGIFGPAGDHLGVRDRWEAYCAENGIKSLIGNYKDNRFNSLFQTAAEVYVHLDSFLSVIKTVSNPNQKIVSVEADLQSLTVQSMLRALSVVYMKVSGPYWWLITSGQISYLQLFKYIQDLEKYLHECSKNPQLLMKEDYTWIKEDDIDIPYITLFEEKISKPITTCQMKLCKDLTSLMCNSMLKTVKKQLCDFLEGGCYSTEPTKNDLLRTSFAPVTNLSCEHHFGDLDSSQRRRPNASFHHHSSVQMLKRNRQQMLNWLNEMPHNEQSQLMKKARKGGIDLRKQHREEEITVRSEILFQMEKDSKVKQRKLVVTESEYDNDLFCATEITPIERMLPNMEDGLKLNEYVAVAYQDAWYPGCVVAVICEKKVKVNFMAPCRKQGTFMWPSRKDEQIVENQFIISKNIIPECCNSGRQWFFKEYEHISAVFDKYRQIYFK